MLGRALRKDHDGYAYLPEEHFRNPKLHWKQQSPNYWAAAGTAPDLVRNLAAVEGVWNPFVYWAEAEFNNTRASADYEIQRGAAGGNW